MSANFFSEENVQATVEMMMHQFDVGDLHSQSSIPSIAKKVKELLADEFDFFNPRQSLMILIAKRSKLAWQNEIIRTKTLV